MSALDLIRDPALRARFESHIAGAYKDACQQQGVMALESTRRAAAIHEAGHAVVYQATADCVRWWPPYRLRIWKEPVEGLNVWLGHTAVSPKAPPIQVTALECDATIIHALRLAAGAVAEMRFDSHDYRQGSSLDELMIVGALARNLEAYHWHRPGECCMALLLAVTARILQHQAKTVMALAATLEARRKLQGTSLARPLAAVSRVNLPVGFDPLMRWTP